MGVKIYDLIVLHPQFIPHYALWARMCMTISSCFIRPKLDLKLN